MTRRLNILFFVLGIGLAALLRFADLTVPDFSTDEAQFALGTSAAQPPLGMWLLQLSQWFFGPELWAVRGMSALLAVMTVALLAWVAIADRRRDAALLVIFLAAVWPSHVLFSRLAYISIIMALAWVLILVCFLRAREDRRGIWMLALFASVLAATFVKTQGFLFPGLLLFGLLVTKRQRILTDATACAILLGVIPIFFYFASHPGVPATILLYAGNRFSVGNLGPRFVELLMTWANVMGPAVLFMAFGVWMLRRCSWPVVALVAVALLQGLYLDPGSSYYSAEVVIITLPIAYGLAAMGPPLRIAVWGVIAIITFALYPPFHFLQSRWTHPLYQYSGYWNIYAPMVNEAIGDAKVVGSSGIVGHEVRWYVNAQVLTREQGSGITLYIKRPAGSGTILYQDPTVSVVRR